MKTKIIATLGPASLDKSIMHEMVKNGVRVFRLNFSHAAAVEFIQALKLIRELELEFGIPLTAMGDLCGPKIRIGDITDSPRNIAKNDKVLLGLPEEKENPKAQGRIFLPLDFPKLLVGLNEEIPIIVADGLLRFKVTRVLVIDRLFEIEALNSGTLTSNKGITFPGKSHPVASLTEKDRKDVQEGLAIGIDTFALSFVQTPKDIVDLIEEMESCGRRVPIITKIERQNAVDCLDELLQLSDGLMVARGDLGLECPLAQVPIIQKRIIRACRHAQKPVIIATQMLLSMVNNVIPTRAEASDVANAMVEGADCVMLSEETAIGANPIEAVKTIREISETAELYYQERCNTPLAPSEGSSSGKFMAYAACVLAGNFKSKAIVCHTKSGLTARYLSSRRASHDLYALSSSDYTVKALNFAWGVNPIFYTEEEASHNKRLENYISTSSTFQSGDNVIMTAHSPILGLSEPQTNKIELYKKS